MRYIIVYLLITLCIASAFAQGEANSLKGVPVNERIVTGGGFGLSFGSYQDFVSVSPMIGYRLTAKLIAGTSVTYRYTNFKYYKPSIKLNDYGVNPFLQFYVYKNIFLQTEYEFLNYEFPATIGETGRKNFNSFLAGGGFGQPFSEKVRFYIMALYNFAYTNPQPGKYYPYDSPLIIRAGITIGSF